MKPINIKKAIKISIAGIILGFALGFTIGNRVAQDKLKVRCADVLNIDRYTIASVKYKKNNTVVIDILDDDTIRSTIDNSIYKTFDKDIINELKEELKTREITIK